MKCSAPRCDAMKTFVYRGFDTRGHSCRGLVEALSIKDARRILVAEGTLARQVVEVGQPRRFPPDMRALMYHELSALLGAGMPLVQALQLLIETPELARVQALLAGVRDRVRDGSGLADAFLDGFPHFSTFEHAILVAAETSGTLQLMLARLGEFIEQRDLLRERIHSALIYPCIVVTVGVCVAILMLGFLLPRAQEMTSGVQVATPLLTRIVMVGGQVALQVGTVFALLALVSAFLVRRRLGSDPEYRSRFDRGSFRVPLWGRGYRLLVNVRFARTLSVLLRGGVSAIEGLRLAGRATGSAWIEELADREADAVQHGRSLSDAVAAIEPLAASLPGWIKVGEAGGSLADLLEKAATREENRWTRFVERSLKILEPALILLIGGLVLLITLAVLLPIFSLTQAVQ